MSQKRCLILHAGLFYQYCKRHGVYVLSQYSVHTLFFCSAYEGALGQLFPFSIFFHRIYFSLLIVFHLSLYDRFPFFILLLLFFLLLVAVARPFSVSRGYTSFNSEFCYTLQCSRWSVVSMMEYMDDFHDGLDDWGFAAIRLRKAPKLFVFIMSGIVKKKTLH